MSVKTRLWFTAKLSS